MALVLEFLVVQEVRLDRLLLDECTVQPILSIQELNQIA